MTRSKVQNMPRPTPSRQQRSRRQQRIRQVRCCRCRAGELEVKEKVKESKKAPPDQGTPADSEVQSQVSKDGSALSRGSPSLSRKTVHSEKEK